MTEPAAEVGPDAPPVPFISRVRIKNYKSIASCDVRLGPLTILVGPNGSGKSNFLDALAFMARALATTPEEAIDERGGLGEILRRVPHQADSFTLGIEATVPWWPAKPELVAAYEFEIGRIGAPWRGRGFEIIHEECVLRGDGGTSRFHAEHGVAEIDPLRVRVHAAEDAGRLFLSSLGGQRPFNRLYAGLSRPRFYNFDTETLRRPQPSATRPLLHHSGEALGDVLAALASDKPASKARIDAYLSAVVQDASAVEVHRAGGYMTIALKSGIDGEEFEFGPLSMSDGTIRAVAVLAALFQPEALNGSLPLVGIEEPETALHPSAAGVLFDALTEASEHVQVIATSQSSDLLDREDLDVDAVRPVAMRDGLTVIGGVDHVSREIVRQKLYTLGELMRGDQLAPEASEDGGTEA
jgi:predicted ATPase